MKIISPVILVTVLSFSVRLYAQSDSLYLQAVELYNQKNDSAFKHMITEYSLDGNYLFEIPRTSLFNSGSSGSSSSYSSYSYRSRNPFAALAQAIAAPFVALGKVLNSLSKAGSAPGSAPEPVKIEMTKTNLLMEMLRKSNFGQQGEYYHLLLQNGCDMDAMEQADSTQRNKYYVGLWQIGTAESDTTILSYLVNEKKFSVDTSASSTMSLRTALHKAVFLSDTTLFRFCINHNADVNKLTYDYTLYSNYVANHWYNYLSYRTSVERKFRFHRLTSLDICHNKEMRAVLKSKGAMRAHKLQKP